jgi:very-short-patch-repair endonuclease
MLKYKMRFTFEQVKTKIEEYGDTLISTEYKNYRQKLQIKCHKCDDEYEQSYQMIQKGFWCTETCKAENYLNRDNSHNGIKKYTYEQVKEIVNKTNNTLCCKEYINTKTKLDIYCNECKTIYQMTFYNFNVLKQGCQNCYIKTRKLTNDKFKEYVESRGDILLEEYIDSRTKIKIQCGICQNIFEQHSNSYRQGAGCKPCSIDRTRLSYNDVKNRIEYYGDKLLSLEYINTQSLLQIKCGNCNQTFEKSLKGSYQPFCKFCNSTKLEKQIMTYLKNKNCLSEHNYQFRFDFYLPNNNVIIEADGKQHFVPVRFRSKDYDIQEWFKIIQERDKIKTKYCIDNNIKIIRISYKEINDKNSFENTMNNLMKRINNEKYVFSNNELYKYLIDSIN